MLMLELEVSTYLPAMLRAEYNYKSKSIVHLPLSHKKAGEQECNRRSSLARAHPPNKCMYVHPNS